MLQRMHQNNEWNCLILDVLRKMTDKWKDCIRMNKRVGWGWIKLLYKDEWKNCIRMKERIVKGLMKGLYKNEWKDCTRMNDRIV